MELVRYETPAWGLPGRKYFRCERLSATLTTAACESNWRQSHEAGAERLHKCRTCPVGAVHAGETTASLSPLRGSKVCGRCQTGTTRLIGRWLCVSCYNREREYRAGRNARGRPPSMLAPLHRRALRILEGGVPRVLSRDLTVNVEELMASALRDSAKSVVFVFNGAPAARYSQGVLW